MSGPGGPLPALAIPYREAAVSPLRIAEASRGTWRTLWLFDRSTGGTDAAQTFLNRIGTVVDITDLDGPDAAAKLAEHEPTGITAFGDDDIMRVAQIAHVLALPYASPTVAKRLTNKVAQRQALRAAGLFVPGFWSVDTRQAPHEVDALVAEARFPVIVKPQRGASSRDTVRADDAQQLRAALSVVDDAWIVEELLRDSWPRDSRPIADYVSVESFVTPARTTHAAITGKTPLADPFRETGSFVPAELSDELTRQVFDVATAAIAAMGDAVSAFHTEIKLTPEGPQVIEVNGRLVGGAVPDVIELACGVSAYRLACLNALGQDLHITEPIACQRVAYLWFSQHPMDARRLTNVQNLDQARQLPGVQEIRLMRQVGDELDWRFGTQGCVFTVVGYAPSHAAMLEARQEVERLVTREYES
jgi:biotin carboxylase